MVHVTQCSRGHYYDSNAFTQCPHCGNIDQIDNQTSQYKRTVASYASAYLQEKTGNKQSPDGANAERLSEYRQSPLRGDEVTIPDPQKPRRSHDERTISPTEENKPDYFVTGWLVCIKGPDRGHSFSLYHGYNTIGYSRSNTISLSKDITVEKNVHCSVVYDGKNNVFYLVPEHSSNTCLNGERITGPTTLEREAVIKIGETELEFIPFCQGTRKWEGSSC